MNNYKILLSFICDEVIFQELGVAYISSFMKHNGYIVEEVVYCEKEDTFELYIQKIIDFKPDIVGINIYNYNKHQVFNICSILKERIPDVYICIGGVEASSQGETLLSEEKSIDFAIKGEGELAFYDLVKCLENDGLLADVDGLIYRGNDKIKVNAKLKIIDNLDSLPNPSRDIFSNNKFGTASVLSSRGCNGNCSFCVTPNIWNVGGVKWRGRNIVLTVDEIENISRTYKIKNIYFDDCTLGDVSRMENLADEIINRKLDIFYSIDVRALLYRNCKEHQINKLKDSGLLGVFLGLEAGNQEDLMLYNKGVKVADNINSLKYFDKHGIITYFGFINFNPYSTIEGLYQNSQFLNDSMQYTLTNIMGCSSYLKAYRGTALYDKIKNDGLLRNKPDLFDYTFVNEKVKDLAEYCYKHLTEILKKYNIIFNDFATIYLRGLKMVERFILAGNVNEKLLPFIKENEQFTRDILIEYFSKNNAFVSLLDLAGQEWSCEKADKIIADNFNENKLSTLINNLTEQKNKLIKILFKYDNDAISLILHGG